jgi:hypothetical protein
MKSVFDEIQKKIIMRRANSEFEGLVQLYLYEQEDLTPENYQQVEGI